MRSHYSFSISKIIYEDNDLLVYHKDAGISVQSARLGEMDLESALRTYLREKNGTETGIPYLAVIHRLDQPVEGLVLFAKTKEAAAKLSDQMQEGGIGKYYLAAVCRQGSIQETIDLSGKTGVKGSGEKHFDPDVDKETDIYNKEETPVIHSKGRWVDYLIRDSKTNMSRIVEKGIRGAKRAELEYEDVTERYPFFSGMGMSEIRLYEIHLLTGRHHQIRVQLQGHGLRLLGDRKYGGNENDIEHTGKMPAFADRISGLRFPALCAYRISFTHPATGEKKIFTIAPSEIAWMRQLQGQYDH